MRFSRTSRTWSTSLATGSRTSSKRCDRTTHRHTHLITSPTITPTLKPSHTECSSLATVSRACSKGCAVRDTTTCVAHTHTHAHIHSRARAPTHTSIHESFHRPTRFLSRVLTQPAVGQVRTITALSLAALAEAATPYGIESFDSVLQPLWQGIREHRSKVRWARNRVHM